MLCSDAFYLNLIRNWFQSISNRLQIYIFLVFFSMVIVAILEFVISEIQAQVNLLLFCALMALTFRLV